MNDFRSDITRRIISMSEIRQRIGSIFPDSVILDNQFNFVSISQNILENTGYARFELLGTSVSRFANTYNLQKFLENRLQSGFFDEEQIEITNKDSGKTLYSISGFYFGLITDINGLIVLKFKNLDEISLNYEKHEPKITELDRFIYNSAQSLRGPLATIKGLVNLAKGTKDLEEMGFLVSQIDSFADKLDDKLHRLIYFAESDKGYESTVDTFDIQKICIALSDEIKEACIDQPVYFQYEAQGHPVDFQNGEVTLSLLRNLVLFFCQQSKIQENKLLLDVHSNTSVTEIVLRAKGFLLSDSTKEKLRSTNIGYSEILNSPELLTCYAAKKIILKLKGNIQFILTPSHDVVVLITFPKSTPLPD